MESSPLLSILLLYNIFVCTYSQNENAPASATSQPAMLEMDVLGFRLWMIIGMVVTGLMIVVIVLCCIFDCRIPRTKQEIEADFEKRKLVNKYKRHLEKQLAKGRKIRIVKGNQRMLAGMALAQGGGLQGLTPLVINKDGTVCEAEPQPGPSEGLGVPDPLAQHPGMMLTGGASTDPRRPLAATVMRPGQTAIARTLASVQDQQQEQQQEQQQDLQQDDSTQEENMKNVEEEMIMESNKPI